MVSFEASKLTIVALFHRYWTQQTLDPTPGAIWPTVSQGHPCIV